MRQILFVFAIAFFPLVSAFAQERAPLRIGISLPLTGDFALFGEEARRGALLAVDEICKRTGEKPLLIFEDDKCLPKDSVTAYKKLTEIDRVDMVVGPGCTGGILSIAPLAAKKDGWVLALLDANRKVAAAGEKIFAFGFSSEEVADLAADEMVKRGLKRAGLLYESDAWAELVKDEFKAHYEAQNGQVIRVEEQRVDNKDYRPAFLRLTESKPDAIYYIPAYNAGVGLKQYRELGILLPMFGPDTFGVQDVLDTAGEAANGVIFVYPHIDSEKQAIKLLEEDYGSRFHAAPKDLLYVALGYDGVRMAYKALRSGRPFPNAMKNIDYNDGVIEVPSFDNSRQARIKPVLMTVEHKRFVLMR